MPLASVDKLSDEEASTAAPVEGQAAEEAGPTPQPKAEVKAAKAKPKPQAVVKTKAKPGPKAKAKVKSKARGVPTRRPAASIGDGPGGVDSEQPAEISERPEVAVERPSKRPSALRRPAAAAEKRKVNKYIYHRDGVWGVKLNGSEIIRVGCPFFK